VGCVRAAGEHFQASFFFLFFFLGYLRAAGEASSEDIFLENYCTKYTMELTSDTFF
jgi:hypothetical protein